MEKPHFFREKYTMRYWNGKRIVVINMLELYLQ